MSDETSLKTGQKFDYKPGQKVALVILRETDLGFVAQINGVDQGLLYHNEVFEKLRPNQELPGYVKMVRLDGSIDLLLQPFGNMGSDMLGQQILETMKSNNGFIPVNDKSPAEDIYDFFGVSRKKFKMALGGLYKKRLIQFTDTGTELVPVKPVLKK
jgi:predicted RNA-binding protein (virulence factor B family)